MHYAHSISWSMLAKQCYLLSLRETFSFPTHFSSLSIWSGPHIAMVCIAGCWILPLNPGLCNTLSLLHAKDFSSICIWRKYFSSGTASASSIRIKETCFYWKVHLCNARVSCAAIYNRFPTPSLFPKYWWNCVMMKMWSLRKVVYRKGIQKSFPLLRGSLRQLDHPLLDLKNM